MGTAEEFKAMVDMVNEKKLVPVIDEVFPMEDAQKAIDKMEDSTQFGKIVLKA
jgi:D-arabinose 1-dehydrogenase-like Zn-dependent alcohol dehydrogenase